MTAVSIPRWQQAQNAERAWWQPPDEKLRVQRLVDRLEDAAWYAGLLNIATVTVGGKHVLDIGGGPLPIAWALHLPLGRLTVLDPMDYEAMRIGGECPTERIRMPAEDYRIAPDHYHEAWGYNVLQHVIDPEAVIATAKRAARVVRWLDWTDTPIHVVHPHSISGDWLEKQFEGWRLTFVTDGVVQRPGWSHSFTAIVAERP